MHAYSQFIMIIMMFNYDKIKYDCVALVNIGFCLTIIFL